MGQNVLTKQSASRLVSAHVWTSLIAQIWRMRKQWIPGPFLPPREKGRLSNNPTCYIAIALYASYDNFEGNFFFVLTITQQILKEVSWQERQQRRGCSRPKKIALKTQYVDFLGATTFSSAWMIRCYIGISVHSCTLTNSLLFKSFKGSNYTRG